MKKIMVALMCVIGCVAIDAFGGNATNVYDFAMNLKTPTLYNGIRKVVTQTYKGYLYAEYVDGEFTSAWATVVSSKTKVAHSINFTEGFYNLMGKSTSKIERSVPTVYLTGADDEAIAEPSSKYGSHETFKVINLAGFGSLESTKTVTIGCGACGEPTKMVEYCNILKKANGYVNGVMDCECPDDEDWWHTLKAGYCGILYDGEDFFPQHEASFYGSWKISFNKKFSTVAR